LWQSIPARGGGENVSDGCAGCICSDRAGGQPPDLAAQQEVGLLSHQRDKRDHSDYLDSGLDFPDLDKILSHHARRFAS
jgi:hypothetical protein